MLVARSGCFNLVDRGSGLNAAEKERAIGGNLGLQRGSNVGQGQVKAADYVLRVMERRADLLGLDEPRRMTISIEEQARMVSEANGLPFEDALEAVKAAEAIIRERV